MVTDKSGDYSAIWRPYHYVGLELAQSIYSIALDKKATGSTKYFNSDVVSVAKKDLNPFIKPQISRNSNVNIETNKMIPLDDHKVIFDRGNNVFHSDSSWVV